MKHADIIRVSRAADLPRGWDANAGSYFQKRVFLTHTETFNPCAARYYVYTKDGHFRAGAVVYTLRINLLTFSRRSLDLPMQVIGIPVSVSAPGMVGTDQGAQNMLLEHIRSSEKGLLLGLNLDPGADLRPGIPMTMLPTIQFERHFPDWRAYMNALRAPYRRRLQHIGARFEGVDVQRDSCRAYSAEHHALYLQIMERTPDKLEVLSETYFRNLPDNFYLVSCRHEGRLLCWHIVCTDGDRFYFFFGGHDYALNAAYQSYYNNLRLILQEAIAGGYSWIDLGQTAEIPKLKLGGYVQPKAFFLYHRQPLIRALLRLFKPLISYRAQFPAFHVFKSNLDYENPDDSSAALAGYDWAAAPDDRGTA